MAGSPYDRSGSAGTGSSYDRSGRSTRPSAPVAPSKKKGGGSFLSHLGGDIVSATVGFPAGLVHLAEHPVRGVKQIADTYKRTYEPLIHGRFGEFGHNFYSHPLGPILDALTLASVIGSRGAAGAMLPEAAGFRGLATAALTGRTAGPLRSLEYTLPSGAKVAGKTLPRNAGRAGRMQATHALLNKLPPDMRILGEFSRAAAQVRHLSGHVELVGRASPVLRDYMKAWQKLSTNERVATSILSRVPLPQDLEAWRARIVSSGDKAGVGLLKALDDPRVTKLYLHPTQKMLTAHDAADKLGSLMEEMLHGHLTPETALARRYQAMALARGLSPDDTRPIESYQAEVAAAGRPQPIYLPDRNATPQRVFGGQAGAGRTPPEKPVHRSEGILFSTGQLALHPDVLSPRYLQTVHHSYRADLHERMLNAAREIPKGEGLPTGHVWVRKIRGERIPFTETTKGDFRAELEQLYPELDPLHAGLVARKGEEALAETGPAGVRYAVPERFARQVGGEFARNTQTLRWIIERPLTVWRALVLNLRVGWLVNNIVGNHFLYALKFAGPDGLRAYLQMVRQTHGGQMVRKLLDLPETRSALSDEEMRALLPELTKAGTFIGSQAPASGIGGRVNRALQLGGAGLAPIDRATEGGLRRAAAHTVLLKEWRRRLPGDTRKFRQWARENLETDEKLRRHVIDEVNGALGDFLSLGPTERSVVRQLVPFYAWYKAITRIALKLPIDSPGRTGILTRVGTIGDEWSAEGGPLPSYLRGAVPLGGNTILKTQSVNPLSTPISVAQALGTLTGAHPSQQGAFQLLGELNPAVAPGAAYLQNLSRGDVSPGHGLIAEVGKNIGRNLPFSRIANPPPSTLYADQGRLAELLAYLGVPVRHLNRGEASSRAQSGR